MDDVEEAVNPAGRGGRYGPDDGDDGPMLELSGLGWYAYEVGIGVGELLCARGVRCPAEQKRHVWATAGKHPCAGRL